MSDPAAAESAVAQPSLAPLRVVFVAAEAGWGAAVKLLLEAALAESWLPQALVVEIDLVQADAIQGSEIPAQVAALGVEDYLIGLGLPPGSDSPAQCESWPLAEPGLMPSGIATKIAEFVALLELRCLERLTAASLRDGDFVIETVESKYKGFFEIQTFDLRHRLFAGGWSESFRRELFVRNEVVVVLPYDPDRDQVVLNEQFRIGSLDDRRSPWLLELVAGMIDAGETPEQVARREAREEGGLELRALLPISEYWVSPGGNNEKVHLYCGRVDAGSAGGLHGLPEEHEDIRIRVLPRAAAYAAVCAGIINNAATIIALQWLELNLQQVRQSWSAPSSGDAA